MRRVKVALLAAVACLVIVLVLPSQASAAPAAAPAKSMGFIGCSMAENVAQGYLAVGGTRMWGPYGTGGPVVQSWTDPNSSAWQKFDQRSSRFGRPAAVWVQICIFSWSGATYDEVKRARRQRTPARGPGRDDLRFRNAAL